MLRTTRYFDPVKTANLFGRITRFIGRRLREDRIGRDNLKAAFPEKSPEEIENHPGRASGTISAASAPSSPISTTSGIMTPIIPRKRAASNSERAPTNCSPSSGTTASRR